MLPDQHRGVIAVALRAVAPYGFALGGSSALAAHGVTGRSTKRIELVAHRETGTREAAGVLDAALRRTGYEADRLDTRIGEISPLGGTGPPEWRIALPAQRHDHPRLGEYEDYTCSKCFNNVYLELSHAPRSRDPVKTDIGPVVHAQDAAGAKVCTLASRGQARDFSDVADLLERWNPVELIGFARRLDPRLDVRDFAHAARRLDQLPEIAFTATGLVRPQDIPRLRERYADWPRDARDIDRQQRERADASRDISDEPGSRQERPEPDQPARQERSDDVDVTTPSAAASSPDPREGAGKRRTISLRVREREAERDGLAIER